MLTRLLLLLGYHFSENRAKMCCIVRIWVCVENPICWERVTRQWQSRGRWWSLGNRRQHGRNDNRQQHWVDRQSSWDGSHSCSMLLGKTTTQLNTMFAADTTGTVISDLSLASCSYGAFDACRGTGYGYQWAAEDREYGECGGSSWRLRTMVNKIAWLPLSVDRVTLDTNQLQEGTTITNGTHFYPICKAWRGQFGNSLYTGKQDWQDWSLEKQQWTTWCSLYTMALEARDGVN